MWQAGRVEIAESSEECLRQDHAWTATSMRRLHEDQLDHASSQAKDSVCVSDVNTSLDSHLHLSNVQPRV